MSITYTVTGAVAQIQFDRVERKNAITAQMYSDMANGLQKAATDSAVRVALLSGHESIFTSGNDIADFMQTPPTQGNAPVFQFLHGIASFPKPLLAAVSGPAIGVGTTLLMHCDVVYASDTALFALPFAQLGLCPEAASSLLFANIAGHQRAAEALLFGDRFSAADAQAMGLVNRVLPVTELMPFALARAQQLAALPASSTRATKKLMKSGQAELVRAKMQEEGEVFRALLQSPEAKEAFSAFMQKRKPDFSQFS
jgi:enoyl-CoA hydratase/carnithine racemase